MAFNSGEHRLAAGHAASEAAFLADDTNKLSEFSVEGTEFEWSARADNVIDAGEQAQSLDGFRDDIGNEVISPWTIAARTSRQIDWLITSIFGDERSALATVYAYDQDRNTWGTYTCVASWTTSESVNNLYRTVVIDFAEAEMLA